MKTQTGFTLVELVTVIILIGILAVTVLPKFDGTASYEAHTHRAQLISALRLTQQRAMQQTDPNAVVATDQPYCHQIVFDNVKSRYGVPDRLDCSVIIFPNDWQPDATGFETDAKYDVTFQIDGKTNPGKVGFNSMGKPLYDCASGCTINVNSSVETLPIQIESEGYVHAK
ncbi:MAG: type II secretion system GspH family protein [Colwellia sp.]